ncbi:hypothetical protein LTR36_001108 [Oleoguttula mirabilis]|uniref:Uncharacterized protein n=1 Tax=Oleoguttula mirabilis TaxID=1507867 RepID=A0AAV9JPD5_9PEZI|nr:hypothetical protein LTR36_001108 [Oleoguttula mirabilis]
MEPAVRTLTPRMTMYEFLLQEKPLPSPPSPTLTNPDMVLPSAFNVAALPSPPRSRGRPPSPTYLRDKPSEQAQAHAGGGSAPPKKEKRGLMSRKMLLLRSRTGSGMKDQGTQSPTIPRSVPALTEDRCSEDYGSTYVSSPTLMDVGNLAPKQWEEKRLSISGSSFNSEEFAAIPSFLAKYDMFDGTTTDDDVESDSPALQKYGYSVSIEGGFDAQRRKQEEDEHNSAILSKRAEQILANAKKRLNLMEGNLRGARDLVAPLTAANLKRATSLGSSHHSSYNSGTSRLAPDGRTNEPTSQQQPVRALHAQASSPTMGHVYQGHARGFSGTQLPERSQTALGRSNGPLRSGRIPVKANDGSWTQGIRSSRSFDSIGNNNGGTATSRGERPLHAKGSPDPALEPLQEDDGSHQAPSLRNTRVFEEPRHDALGIQRPASRTEDLREQIGTLKGKISSLKERAREDSLRRQSTLSLRTPSPFNNAVATAPEYFYTQSPTYGSAMLDTNAGVGHTSRNNSPVTPQSLQNVWEQSRGKNAFVEQSPAQAPLQNRASPNADRVAQGEAHRQLASETQAPRPMQHRRTPSGTAIIEPAANRYSHHQSTPGNANSAQDEQPLFDDSVVSPLPIEEPPMPDYDYVVSEAGDERSVYEDAEYEQPPVIAHEDRDDAFDYEHFFLHSAMHSYGFARRSSKSSEDSVSSAETARGPVAVVEDDCFDPSSSMYPPPTPETPERLREIERKIHKRTLSAESVSTTDSFATAAEGRISPPMLSRQASALDWPMPPTGLISQPPSRPSSRPNSRPSTAFRQPERRRDSSSGRADSGIGIGVARRPNSSHDRKRPGVLTPRSPHPTSSSPPMSPKTTVLHDPATLAVKALLEPTGRPLGLQDNALIFSIVESLRKVCHRMQEEDEGQYESRVLRRRLDEARRALDGTLQQRPGTS